MKSTDQTTALMSSPNAHKSGAYHYAFFRSIDLAAQDWDAAAPAHDLFLQRPYLSVLEHNPPQGMRFGYFVFYRRDEPIGVALCQIKYFKADENINEEEEPARDPCFFTSLARWVKRWVAGKVAADILICGNMLLTGEHGYYFDYHKISPKKAIFLLEDALEDGIRQLEREGTKISFILVKDLPPELRSSQGKALVGNDFTEFDIQPNMVLELPWGDFEEYLSAMSTKYRTRAKRAFKKAADLEKKELSLAEIQRELPRMYGLYKEIASNAGFNMVDLNEHYLAALKRDLPQQFRLFAYYHEGHLIAFYSTLKNNDELEAHFLGFEKSLNHDRQLYLNILYDIVRIGLEAGSHRIVFARTALEIKSSVGALPQDLFCYVRNQNSLANHFTGAMLDYLKPVEKWQPRHPFKGEDSNA